MQRLVNTMALTAALVAVGMALLRDYGLLVTLKRAAIAYFAFYALGAALVFVFKTGIEEEWIRDAHRRRAIADAKRKKAQMEAERQHYASMEAEAAEVEAEKAQQKETAGV